MALSFLNAYLTPKQLSIWFLRRQGRTQAEIGRDMGVQRQVIYEQFHLIDEKVGRALMEAAQSNRLDIHRIDTVNGVMEAHSPSYDMPVVVSFSKSNGIQVWYLYEGGCDNCNRNPTCQRMLKAEAEERGIKLSESDLKLKPTLLGRKIFSTITANMNDEG